MYKIHTYTPTNKHIDTQAHTHRHTDICSGYGSTRNERSSHNSYARTLIKNLATQVCKFLPDHTYALTPQLLHPLSLRFLNTSYVSGVIMSCRKF